MSGVFLLGGLEGKAHAERVTGPVQVSGIELLVRVDLGLGESTVEVLVSRDPDDTLVFKFPDGRIQRAVVSRDGKRRWVTAAGRTLAASEVAKKRGAVDLNPSLEAPMPGKVARVLVKVGDRVTKGQTLLTVEAMKMEHALKSPRDGIIEALAAAEDELVSPGTPLVKVAVIAVEP
jgi:biotin carboxyl carrier protein